MAAFLAVLTDDVPNNLTPMGGRILDVFFGDCADDAREKACAAINADIAQRFPQRPLVYTVKPSQIQVHGNRQVGDFDTFKVTI